MFGNAAERPQRETTPFDPRSPYAAAKAGAHAMTKVYREAYGLFACNGILFNHESPRRGPTFVTRKITRGIAQILSGEADALYLGNLDASRDWGFAPEYMEAAWLMLQQDEPDDYVIATGESHSVREFLNAAFAIVRLDVSEHVRFDSHYLRPAEVDYLLGDAAKARTQLGWRPGTSFEQLVRLMVESDLRAAGLDPELYVYAGGASRMSTAHGRPPSDGARHALWHQLRACFDEDEPPQFRPGETRIPLIAPSYGPDEVWEALDSMLSGRVTMSEKVERSRPPSPAIWASATP